MRITTYPHLMSHMVLCLAVAAQSEDLSGKNSFLSKNRQVDDSFNFMYIIAIF